MSDSMERLAELSPHVWDSSAEVHTADNGWLWVAHQELIDCGYTNLEDFTVIYINGQWWELQAHSYASYRILKQHHPVGIWWIEPIEAPYEMEVPESPPQPGDGEG